MSFATTPQNHPALSVASTAELRVVSTGTLIDGDIAYVQVDGAGISSYWRLSKSATNTTGTGTIYSGDSTLGVGAGRWFRLGFNGLGGNTVVADQSANDATFWPVGGFATQLSCSIVTSGTRLWVEFSASGVSVALGTGARSLIYVTTGGVGPTLLTNATLGGGGVGTSETTVALDTFNMGFCRLLTGLTAGTNVVEIYCDADGATAQCNPTATATHHATLRVTEV